MGIKLKPSFAEKFKGIAADRIVERNAGCWNCVHYDSGGAKKLWWEKARQETLQRGVQIALKSPLGERDPKVLAIRDSVPKLDIGFEQATWGKCGKRGKVGAPEADFVNTAGMCALWTGAVGASLAREGERINELPRDLMEMMKDRLVPENDPDPNKPEGN